MPEDFYAPQVLEKPHGNVIIVAMLFEKFKKRCHYNFTNGEYGSTTKRREP